MFESIYKYVKDLEKYLVDLEDGVFIQLTLDLVLLSPSGKQLMTESLYLYGVMLILLDQRIEGIVRERLVISYYRYKGQQAATDVDEVSNLVRQTGYNHATGSRPKEYPESYFNRIKINAQFVSMIIGRLRSDDIYNQVKAYPLPDHRSTALATQASMLYVILFFAPDILNKENATMREIVDKHFSDNWVIAFYMGNVVDLSVAWEPYKAAKAALKNTTDSNIRDLQQKHIDKVPKVLKQLALYLTEGVLQEEYILDNIHKLLATMREANVTIRWLMLHVETENKKLREQLTPGVDRAQLLSLLLDTAQFEFLLKNKFNQLLGGKQARWDECKSQAAGRMTELGEYFSGEKPLTRVAKDEQLQKWFTDIAAQVSSLEYTDSTVAGRKIQQLTQALEEVEQFHQIDTSLQIKAFLHDTRQLLAQMLRTINIRDEVVVIIEIVADISYAWSIVKNYVDLMQARIKQDPSTTIKLRATFLKLASILQLPLIRIMECNSPDLVSVSEYYSGELVSFVRIVLEIIPKSMFQFLDKIIQLQTFSLKEVPTRLDRAEIATYAQLETRQQLAQLTHAVSVFTEGILAMETTLVGVIKVDPKQLLEDGIRKELVLQIATSLHQLLQFKTGKMQDTERSLSQLADRLDGFRKSFEYISDYVNIFGLKIWQEEFSRIVNYNVEQECNSFLKRKVYDFQSQYQSVAIPIPRFQPVDESITFVGRLARELMSQTDAKKSVFVDLMSAWIDRDGREIVGIRTFSLLQMAVGIFGLTGLDKLLCFMIVTDLQRFVAVHQKQIAKLFGPLLKKLSEELDPPTSVPRSANKLYSACLDKMKKLWPILLDYVIKIGQRQLLRKMVANELNFSCKLDSNVFACALSVMDSSLVNDVQHHYRHPDVAPYPDAQNPILGDLTRFLETAGISDAMTKIYVTVDPIENLALLMFLFVLAHLNKFTYDATLGTLVSKDKKEAIDGAPFVVGVLTVLKQFHSIQTQRFLALFGQYVRAQINDAPSKDDVVDLDPNVTNSLLFLEQFCKFSSMSRRVVESYIPAYIFDRFKRV
eukprot:TRINITY_DN9095_c0_g1_i1.p1 TRINITY_DN9095_c0_g1~~TRINITY_DN9095_c0_g1_i1.p1  ORF type:complete len:1142 (+),score=349.87 TRINITY_DN9095_c0_g1_i1:288-3428(+)